MSLNEVLHLILTTSATSGAILHTLRMAGGSFSDWWLAQQLAKEIYISAKCTDVNPV
ncbi:MULTISPECIES: hypothetical protein [Pantoea]|jgi:hypothetical protein|uniref:Uncharacterized protein n=1 Tax=Pantoea brenneri TaxID=472694 RepID=A0A7Y6NH21_9GAMM|nr:MULTISPECIES: hypothetical protein [Pantoea]MBZ6397031.1 hypothetical protein [Pantoea sp.]MBZ6440218.1 hypothetical protein [Pantoea sp.]NUY43420.1 hypothetical protein [Pantoea brenneri]NUY51014.1 hypothetical protein [Pantoea brenneri]NUY61255.1 hypothetical protein [Pantoea brenneri]